MKSFFLLTALLFSSVMLAFGNNPALVVETPAYPLFNLSQNEPVFRLKVVVPASSEPVQVESFKMIFGTATWKYLDKATIYYTADEPVYEKPVEVSSATVSKP